MAYQSFIVINNKGPDSQTFS